MPNKIINIYKKKDDIEEKEEIVFTGCREACRNFLGRTIILTNHSCNSSYSDGKYLFDYGDLVYYTTEEVVL